MKQIICSGCNSDVTSMNCMCPPGTVRLHAFRMSTSSQNLGFGPGWPTIQQEPPDFIEVPLEEAVELLLRHHSSSVQVLLEKLKARGIVLARARQ